MSAVVILLVVKFSRFRIKDKSENTFIKNMSAESICSPRHHKVRKNFANDNTPLGVLLR